MKRKMEAPEGHEMSGVTFNHITKTIIVGSYLGE